MPERAFEAVLTSSTRGFRDSLSEVDRQEVNAATREIEADPYPDGETKVTASMPRVGLPPLEVTVYFHQRWWLYYRIPAPGRVVIETITPAMYPPGRALGHR